MSELNILQQNIDKPNTVTEEDIVVTRDNQTFTIKGRFNGEEGVFTYDALTFNLTISYNFCITTLRPS
ncbi:MAG: hypothetical protein ACLSH7_04835 [Veillonella parvula]